MCSTVQVIYVVATGFPVTRALIHYQQLHAMYLENNIVLLVNVLRSFIRGIIYRDLLGDLDVKKVPPHLGVKSPLSWKIIYVITWVGPFSKVTTLGK